MPDAAALARAELEHLLEPDAPALPSDFVETAERYVRLLLGANQRLNLTRVVEPGAVARLHLLDSIVAVPLLDERMPERAVDLGTGGGVPGIVLALARPQVSWTLVDSVGKKADAVRAFAAELGLASVQVVAERAEILGRDAAFRERFDLVTARACAALPVLVEYALPLLRAGGRLIAWKGSIGEDELRDGAAAASTLGGGIPRVRAAGHAVLGEHRFVVVEKERATPAAYPRQPGLPSRRPLANG